MAAADRKYPRGASSSSYGPRILLLLSVFALLAVGFVMLYSASSIDAISQGLSSDNYVVRQLVFGAAGIVGALVVWKVIPYHWWSENFLQLAWIAVVILLLLTPFIGREVNGARRWIGIGEFGIQPSEFAKVVFVLMMARIMRDLRNQSIDGRRALIECVLYIILPVFWLFWTQSDLGTTVICFVGILAVIWLGEMPIRYFVFLLVFAVVFAVLASTIGYRQDRFLFLNPWEDGEGGLGKGYQLIHSFYAFAEGGIFGVGLGNSREKFLYLPEAENDFIFAIIGEELGLIGALVVVVLFLAFLYAGLRITRTAPDQFGAMISGGCTIMVVFQAFLNIGCVIGVLPTTGKPLPFISAGGSSLIVCLLLVGLVLSVSSATDRPSIHEQRRDDLRIIRAKRSGTGGRT